MLPQNSSVAYSGSAAEQNESVVKGKIGAVGASVNSPNPINFLQGLPNTSAGANAAGKMLSVAHRSPMAGAGSHRLMMSPMVGKDAVQGEAAMHPIVPNKGNGAAFNQASQPQHQSYQQSLFQPARHAK